MTRPALVNTLMAASLIVVVLVSNGGTSHISSVLANTSTTINFDDLTPGTIVSNQYASQGVVFEKGILPLGQNNVYCDPIITQVSTTDAESGDQIATTGCANGEFPNSSIAGVLTNAAATVSVYAGFLANSDTPPDTVQMTLTGYDINDNQIASQSVTLTAGQGFHTLLQISSGSPNIVYFTVTAPEYPTLGVDDLTFDNPGGLPPDFRLQPEGTEIGVPQGFSNSEVIDINRENGSTGGITFSASGLPSGVQASFSPNPAAGVSTTMTLSAAPNAPLTTTYPYPPLTIDATPDSSSAGVAPQTTSIGLDVYPPFALRLYPTTPPNQNPPAIEVPPCSTVSVPVAITWSLDPITFKQPFSGAISLSLSGVPSDDQASLNPSTVSPSTGTNSAKSTLTLSSASDATGATSSVTITGTSGQVTESSTPMLIERVAPTITGMTPGGGQTPQALQPGTPVKIEGHGFCPGTTVDFGNSLAATTPTSISNDGTTMQTSIPRLGTSGNVYAVPSGGSISSPGTAQYPGFNVDSYRNTNGLAFDNSSAFQNREGGWHFSDISDVFGYDQTHYSVNPCWPFGDCTIASPVPTVGALLEWGLVNAIPWSGQCFGFVLSTQRLLHGDEHYSNFPLQAGKIYKTVWNLQGPDASDGTPGASSDLGHYVHDVHIEQLSGEFMNYWLGETEKNLIFGTQSSIINQVKSALAGGDHPIMAMINGGVSGLVHGEAHAVDAYDVEPGSNGDMIIDVYNPDAEFKTSEDTDITGSTHLQAIQNSQIIVHPDGHWEFKGFNPEWHGGPGSLVVVPYGTPPVQPTLLTSLSGLLDVTLGGASDSQVTDGSGHTLLNPDGTVNTSATTGISDATRVAPITDGNKPGPSIFVFGKAGAYDQTIVGKKKGSYDNFILGSGTGASVKAQSITGSKDSLSLLPGKGTLQFGQIGGNGRDTSRRVSAQVFTAAADGSQRTADIGTTMSTQGLGSMSFNGAKNVVTVSAGKQAMNYTLSLSWAGVHGYPQTFAAPKVNLPAGASASLTPVRWTSLQSSAAKLTVTKKDGSKTTRMVKNMLHGENSYTVTLKVAKPRGAASRKLTIETKIKKLVKGSTATLVWQVLKGSSMVGSHTVSLPATKLHKGLLHSSFRYSNVKAGGKYMFKAQVAVFTTATDGSTLSQSESKSKAFHG